MASAKKRRGRERKAARKNNNNYGGGRPISTIGDWEDEGKTFGAVKLVELVRRGHFEATSSVIACYRDNEADRPLFVRAGLLDVVFGHLGRCNEHFGSVMREIGGDLVSPNIWVELLGTLLD